MDKAFQLNDGWLLFSIGFGDEPSTLKMIISRGDILNHAIFNLEEINEGLHRLIQNGLVEMVDKTCRCTQEARELNASRPKRSRGLFEDWADFARRLQKRPSKCDGSDIVYFSKKEYLAACDEYQDEMRQWIAGHTRRRKQE